MSAEQEVSAPAIGLLITAAVGGVGAFLGLMARLLGFGIGAMMSRSVEEQFAHWLTGGFGIFFSTLALLVAGFIIYAALEMQNLRQWGLAVAASVVAMLPCVSPCCIIGLPVGIWSLVILTRPDVKAAFH
jgi:hypothetical protein